MSDYKNYNVEDDYNMLKEYSNIKRSSLNDDLEGDYELERITDILINLMVYNKKNDSLEPMQIKLNCLDGVEINGLEKAINNGNYVIDKLNVNILRACKQVKYYED